MSHSVTYELPLEVVLILGKVLAAGRRYESVYGQWMCQATLATLSRTCRAYHCILTPLLYMEPDLNSDGGNVFVRAVDPAIPSLMSSLTSSTLESLVKRIDLSKQPDGDILNRILSRLPNITEIILSWNPEVNDMTIFVMAKHNPLLALIDVSGCHYLTEVCIPALAQFILLKELKIDHKPCFLSPHFGMIGKFITNSRMACIEDCQDLEKCLKCLPNLRVLDLDGRSIVFNSTIAVLADYNRGLITLHLRHCPNITIACLSHLHKIQSLEYLHLTAMEGLSDTLVMALVLNLPNLIGLDISGTPISDALVCWLVQEHSNLVHGQGSDFPIHFAFLNITDCDGITRTHEYAGFYIHDELSAMRDYDH